MDGCNYFYFDATLFITVTVTKKFIESAAE